MCRTKPERYTISVLLVYTYPTRSVFAFFFHLISCFFIMFGIFFEEGLEEASPDLDLVADVIEHIDRHGEPGN